MIARSGNMTEKLSFLQENSQVASICPEDQSRSKAASKDRIAQVYNSFLTRFKKLEAVRLTIKF